METLVKRNGLMPVMNTSLFPSVNTFFDDFISRDLFIGLIKILPLWAVICRLLI